MFDNILLRTFATVASENGFTRAATKLNLTQSAVSTHLRRLETQVGRPLMVRTTRSVALTPEGEILLTYARAILELNRAAKARLSNTAIRRTLRIGLPEDFARPGVISSLQNFAEHRLGLTLELAVGVQSGLLDAFDKGDLDLVVGAHCHSQRPGRRLWSEPLVWVGGLEAALMLPAPLPLAFFPDPCPFGEVAVAALAQNGTEFRVAVRCSSMAGMIAAARAGVAIATIPVSQMCSGLHRLRPEQGLPQLPDVEFKLFSREGSEGGVFDELAETLVAVLRGAPTSAAS